MEISDQTFARAKKLKRAGVEELFASAYPTVVRLARGLCGREDVAEGVVRFVMGRAIKVLPGWRDATAAERWFLHHTVLTARRAAGHEPDAGADLLASGADAPMRAFVRAVRVLSQQQREAVILHYGEHLNARYLGIAMDCSADAAQTHLDAGVKTLRAVGGDGFEGMIKRTEAAHAALKPPEGDAPATARRYAAKGLRPRRLRRVLITLAVLALVAGAVWWYLK
jgi:DNA-directed RNA polymerase specialized sigma24 family protein